MNGSERSSIIVGFIAMAYMSGRHFLASKLYKNEGNYETLNNFKSQKTPAGQDLGLNCQVLAF